MYTKFLEAEEYIFALLIVFTERQFKLKYLRQLVSDLFSGTYLVMLEKFNNLFTYFLISR